jgi:peroxiredoxin
VPGIWKIPQYYVFQRFTFAQKRFCGAEGLENVVNYPIFKKEILVKKNGLKSLTVPSRLTFQECLVADAGGTITYIRTGAKYR